MPLSFSRSKYWSMIVNPGPPIRQTLPKGTFVRLQQAQLQVPAGAKLDKDMRVHLVSACSVDEEASSATVTLAAFSAKKTLTSIDLLFGHGVEMIIGVRGDIPVVVSGKYMTEVDAADDSDASEAGDGAYEDDSESDDDESDEE